MSISFACTCPYEHIFMVLKMPVKLRTRNVCPLTYSDCWNLLLSVFIRFPRFYTSCLRGQSWRNLKTLCFVRALSCVKRNILNYHVALTLLWPGSIFFFKSYLYFDRGMFSPSHLIRNLASWLWRPMAGCIDSQPKQEKHYRKFISLQMLNSSVWTLVSEIWQ